MSREAERKAYARGAQELSRAREAEDVAALEEYLRYPEWRAHAARFLADIDARGAIPAITQLLDAGDRRVRVSAARSLGRLRADSATERLAVLARSDPERIVRSWAVYALGALGTADSVRLVTTFLDDDDAWVRRAAAVALGEHGPPSVREALERAARREPLHRRKPYRRALRLLRKREKSDRCAT